MSQPVRPDPEGWRAVRDPEPGAGPSSDAARGFREPATGSIRSADARLQLWLDSLTIVVGVLFALAVFNVFAVPAGGGPIQSPTDEPDASDGIVIGTLQPPATLPPAATLGPVVDPGIGLDATPTPVPVITLRPTAKPTPRPTPKPTAKTTPKPPPATAAPSPVESPTAAQATP